MSKNNGKSQMQTKQISENVTAWMPAKPTTTIDRKLLCIRK